MTTFFERWVQFFLYVRTRPLIYVGLHLLGFLVGYALTSLLISLT